MDGATPGGTGSRGPLTGYRVGITADRGRQELAEALQRVGAESMLGPTVASVPLAQSEALEASTEEAISRPPEVLLLTSYAGGEGWVSNAERLGRDGALVEALAQTRVFVLAQGQAVQGQATPASLGVPGAGVLPRDAGAALGLLVDVVGDLCGRRVSVQTGEGGCLPGLVEVLRGTGAQVVEVAIPGSAPPVDSAPARGLVEAVIERRVDALTFIAPGEVRNLVRLADDLGVRIEMTAVLNDDVLTACSSPSCTRTASSLGLHRVVQPDRAKVGAFVDTVVERLGETAIHLELGGVDVALRGALAVIGGEDVWLAHRERGLLAALARRPGTVVTKAELLQRVWGSDGVDGADAHAVEVAVARLRRRLGVAGTSVQAVPRRGYRLVAG
ncbi:uroporphyrinogen-III synthase [soil metagenome]